MRGRSKRARHVVVASLMFDEGSACGSTRQSDDRLALQREKNRDDEKNKARSRVLREVIRPEHPKTSKKGKERSCERGDHFKELFFPPR